MSKFHVFITPWILLIIYFITISKSEILNCNFVSQNWDSFVVNPYSCNAISVDFKSRKAISQVNGQHKPDHNNDNVNAVKITGPNCYYLPSGIGEFFENVEALAVQQSNLMAIRKDDLKPFPKLKSLSLFNNLITSLEFSLFIHNPKLQIVSFYQNFIESIGDDVFDNLNDLVEIHFNNNKCTNIVAKNKNDVAKFKKAVLTTCDATEDLKHIREIENKMQEAQNECDKIFLNSEKCSAELTACNNKNQENSQNLKNCEVEFGKKTTEMEVFSKKCDQDLSNLNQKINQLTTECKNTEFDSCIVKVKNLNGANADLSKNITEINKKLAQVNLECQALETNFRNQTNQLKSCEEEKTRLESLQATSIPAPAKCSQVLDIKCSQIHNDVCIWKDAIISFEGMEIGNVYGPDGTIIQTTDQITELQITGGSVHYLPSNLGKIFGKLKILIIDGTGIQQIGEHYFDDFTILESLTITNGKVRIIHENAFKKTIKLLKLNLGDNNLTEFHSFMSPLSNLREFNIEKNFITIIEWKIFKSFKFLEVLKIGQNPLKHVDTVIAIKKIKELDMSGDGCINMKYPDESLEKVSARALTNCAFEVKIECDFKEESGDYVCYTNNLNIIHENTIVSKIVNKKGQRSKRNITKFVVKNQKIMYFPQNFYDVFKYVIKIEILNSHLTKLITFKNLVWISAIGNNIEYLYEDAFKESAELLHVDFSRNKIGGIPINLFMWSRKVREFIMESNEVRVLSWYTFSYLEHLEVLKMRQNKLTQIDWNFDKSKVKTFDLRDNSCINNYLQTYNNKDQLIRGLASSCAPTIQLMCDFRQEGDDYICNAVNFTILSENTKVTTIVDAHSSSKRSVKDVTKFTVHNQNMHFFPSNFNKLFVKLRKIEIVSSNLKKITKLDNLEWIKIRDNDVTFIDEGSFEQSLQLIYLEISYSKILQFPDKLLNQLEKLEEVNFEGNLVTTISWVMFTDHSKLRIINVRNNQLTKIQWMESLTSSKSEFLDLSGNKCIDIQYPANTMESLMEKINNNCGTEADLKCEFDIIGTDYICNTIDFVVEGSNTKIINVKGVHKPGKSNRDVSQVHVKYQNVNTYPYNIFTFFPDLKRFLTISKNNRNNFVFVDGKRIN